MTLIEKNVLAFFDRHIHQYRNSNGVDFQMDSPGRFYTSALIKEDIQQGWALSVCIEAGSVKQFIEFHNISTLADIDRIVPAMLQDLYYQNHGNLLCLVDDTTLWFQRRPGNGTLVTGDLQAITYESLTEPEDFVSFAKKLISSNEQPNHLKIN